MLLLIRAIYVNITYHSFLFYFLAVHCATKKGRQKKKGFRLWVIFLLIFVVVVVVFSFYDGQIKYMWMTGNSLEIVMIGIQKRSTEKW